MIVEGYNLATRQEKFLFAHHPSNRKSMKNQFEYSASRTHWSLIIGQQS